MYISLTGGVSRQFEKISKIWSKSQLSTAPKHSNIIYIGVVGSLKLWISTAYSYTSTYILYYLQMCVRAIVRCIRCYQRGRSAWRPRFWSLAIMSSQPWEVIEFFTAVASGCAGIQGCWRNSTVVPACAEYEDRNMISNVIAAVYT